MDIRDVVDCWPDDIDNDISNDIISKKKKNDELASDRRRGQLLTAGQWLPHYIMSLYMDIRDFVDCWPDDIDNNINNDIILKKKKTTS